MSQSTQYTWVNATFKDTYEVITKGELPIWFVSGDLVIRRGTRYFARSQTQTEPRYRRLLRMISAAAGDTMKQIVSSYSEKVRKKGK